MCVLTRTDDVVSIFCDLPRLWLVPLASCGTLVPGTIFLHLPPSTEDRSDRHGLYVLGVLVRKGLVIRAIVFLKLLFLSSMSTFQCHACIARQHSCDMLSDTGAYHLCAYPTEIASLFAERDVW